MHQTKYTLFLIAVLLSSSIFAQVKKSPDRKEGDGPYSQLIFRGVTVINGNGAPPSGPIDVVVENNTIKEVKQVGYPGVPIDPKGRPQLKPGGKEYNCEGMYMLPGLVDMHGHIGGQAQGADAEYVFKLWMGHGITTVRDPGAGNGLDWVLEHKKRSEKNEITAPRLVALSFFGQGAKDGINTPEQAREWVRQNAQKARMASSFLALRQKL